MNTSKQILNNLIEDISDNELNEVIDFITYLKLKRDKEVFNNLINASVSSTEFWDNENQKIPSHINREGIFWFSLSNYVVFIHIL